MLPSYNTKRQQINIQNPQYEHIVNELVDNEHECDMGIDEDPFSFIEAMKSSKEVSYVLTRNQKLRVNIQKVGPL